jgi:cytochrome c
MRAKPTIVMGCVLALWLGMAQAQGVDAGAAEALMRKSGCFKCHSISAKKDGPSYKSVAEKYKGKPDAEAKLYTHLTTNPKVKVDGKEELHESLKTKNDAEIKNVIQFVLSR